MPEGAPGTEGSLLLSHCQRRGQCCRGCQRTISSNVLRMVHASLVCESFLVMLSCTKLRATLSKQYGMPSFPFPFHNHNHKLRLSLYLGIALFLRLLGPVQSYSISPLYKLPSRLTGEIQNYVTIVLSALFPANISGTVLRLLWSNA